MMEAICVDVDRWGLQILEGLCGDWKYVIVNCPMYIPCRRAKDCV